MKVAVASTDGLHINNHFGKSSQFYIYQQRDNKFTLQEIRNVVAFNESSKTEMSHKFKKKKLDSIALKIDDCSQIYVKQIGETPKNELENRGFEVIESSQEISAINLNLYKE